VHAGKLAQRVKRHAVRRTNDAIGFGVKRGVPLVPVHQMPQPGPIMYVPYLIGFSDAARGLVRVAAITATNAFGVIVFICIRGVNCIHSDNCIRNSTSIRLIIIIRGIRGTRHFRNGNRLFNIEGSVVPNAVAGLKYAGKGHNRRKVIQIKKTMRFVCNYVRFLHSLGTFKKRWHLIYFIVYFIHAIFMFLFAL